jgi:hypothetical protein
MMIPAAVILRRVLLPAMFGPVNKTWRGFGSDSFPTVDVPPSATSLGIKLSVLSDMDACRSSAKSTKAESELTNVGRHFGSSIIAEAFDRETRQSSSANTRIVLSHRLRSLSNSPRR